MKYANLHLHSTHSDGNLRPAHLVRIAKSLGYRALALTDHDVMSGVPELLEEAKAEGMGALSGIEFTCYLDNVNLHIVALDFRPDAPELADFVGHLCRMRNEHTRRQFELAVERGILGEITWEEVVALNPGCQWFCNEQVYRAAERKGVQARNDRRTTYGPAFKTGEAAAIRLEQPDAAETLRQIREAGGISVLAHPEGQLALVPRLVALGLDGLEVCHPDISAETQRGALALSRAYGLYRSGGTDHTGALGVCGGAYSVAALHGATQREFDRIRERRGGAG